MMLKSMKSYKELIKIDGYDNRLKYLMIPDGKVGDIKWGSHRPLNQLLYKSNKSEWSSIRRKVIIRDSGCDLGLDDYPIYKGRITVHHINPITEEDILNRDPKVFDLNNLITVSHRTHMQIHYGSFNDDLPVNKERYENDTIPWR